MRFTMLGCAAVAALHLGAAYAEEPVFEPLPLLDLAEVSPDFADDIFGHWTISDDAGSKICAVELLREPTIGGMRIEIGPGCAEAFPVMADITAWRLLEGWVIDLADGERKTRVRFSVPDERYAVIPEVDGIATM